MILIRLLRRSALSAVAALGLCWIAPAQAVDVQRVVSPGGIEAWLVEDHSVPVLAMDFAFKGGAALDPDDRLGLANLLSTLLDEGAGDLESQEFQKLLEDNAISLGFDAGMDAFYGSLKTLTENRDTAFDLLGLALTEPRFDPQPVQRMRNAVLAGLNRQLSDPGYLAGRLFFSRAFPDHPYGRPVEGTPETVASITVDDLRAYVEDRFAQDNLFVAVAGDITAEELGTVLDEVFGRLPEEAAPFEIPDTEMANLGQTFVQPFPIPQTILITGEPGVERQDPDFYAAFVMNYILGGGSFSSRLMEEIREERGLTYGVGSSLIDYDEAALIVANMSTMNARAGEALDLLKSEWQRLAEGGVTEEELEAAKTYLTGSFPLRFSSTDRITGFLLGVQMDDLGVEYIDERNALIEAVTQEDIARVAREMLDASRLLTVAVGQPEGVEGETVPAAR